MFNLANNDAKLLSFMMARHSCFNKKFKHYEVLEMSPISLSFHMLGAGKTLIQKVQLGEQIVNQWQITVTGRILKFGSLQA